METLVYLFVAVIRGILSVLQLLMLARAIISWLPFDDDSPLQRFLHVTTEPLIIPVRNILERFEFFAGFPIDLSFMVTYIILSILTISLPSIHF